MRIVHFFQSLSVRGRLLAAVALTGTFVSGCGGDDAAPGGPGAAGAAQNHGGFAGAAAAAGRGGRADGGRSGDGPTRAGAGGVAPSSGGHDNGGTSSNHDGNPGQGANGGTSANAGSGGNGAQSGGAGTTGIGGATGVGGTDATNETGGASGSNDGGTGDVGNGGEDSGGMPATGGTAGAAVGTSGDAGTGTSGGASGAGGTANGNAGSAAFGGVGAAAGTGAAGPQVIPGVFCPSFDAGLADISCSTSSDCNAKFGERGCGSWSCNSAGKCAISEHCSDEDQDGYFAGPDCAGKPLDCDDHDPNTGDTASASCCGGGTRACSAGSWSLCSTATGETCDGLDNDCNGVPDDLGDITCGVGACQRTVSACTSGALGVCVPATPTTTVDGCNGIDDDCDGAVDEDCAACIHVAPDGDDALAAGNGAATPFQTLQAGIDFADGHRNVANRVCVAAGAACGATATYNGPAGSDLTMRDGISVLANYESSGWTHCDNSTTHVATTTRGVVFPANIAVESALDGFTIDRPADDVLIAGVTVDGARGVMLSNLTIVDGTYTSHQDGLSFGTSYGVNLVNGASATLVRDNIDGGRAYGNTGVRASASRVFIQDSCSGTLDPVTGRCTGTCSTGGPKISARGGAYHAGQYAVLLDNAPGSRIERSTICAVDSPDASGAAAIRVQGSGSDIRIRANTVDGTDQGDPNETMAHAGLWFQACGDGAPWVVDNQAIGLQVTGQGFTKLIYAAGDCHPVIEANPSIVLNVNYRNYGLTGISCEAVGGVASRCVIANNPSILGANDAAPTYSGTSFAQATGVNCAGSSCARISNNHIDGIESSMSCSSRGICGRSGFGLVIGGGSAQVTDNVILPGHSNTTFTVGFSGYGVQATGATTFLRNQISGGFSGGAADFESNAVLGTGCPGEFTASYCYGVAWSAGGGTLANNCINGYADAFIGLHPSTFVNNELFATSGTIYSDDVATCTTAAQVNALTDMTVSGTLAGSCTATPYPP